MQMAAEKLNFDDLEPVDSSNDDDDPTIKLDPGEALVATVRYIERDVGKWNNSVLHLTTQDGDAVKMWSNATIDRKLDEADVGPNDTIGLRKSEERYTYERETEDGDTEEGKAYDFEVRSL